MAHNINVYIFDGSLDHSVPSTLVTPMKQGFAATTSPVGLPSKYVYVRTDYFGGTGNQSAILYNDFTEPKQIEFTEQFHIHPINEALKLMGISKENNMDEFDSLGLGRYRSNEDFNSQINDVMIHAITLSVWELRR